MVETTHADLLQKLHDLDKQVARLESHLQSELGNLRRSLDDLHEGVDNTHSQLFGSADSTGLRGKVDRLETTEKNRNFWIQAIGVAVIGLALNAVWSVLAGG